MTARRLRVVDESSGGRVSPRVMRYDQHGQLELDLGDDRVRRILVAAMDRIHGLRLHELVTEVHPVVVLDLRNTIRFDLPGTNRDRFLEIVSRVQSSYMRAPMTWHGDLRAPVHIDLVLPVRLHHEVVERHDGNLMLLVNKPEHALRISSMLNVTLSQNHIKKWDIEQVM